MKSIPKEEIKKETPEEQLERLKKWSARNQADYERLNKVVIEFRKKNGE